MNIFGLGRVFAIKYAADSSLRDVARDIKLMANSYALDTSKKGIVHQLATMGDSFCKHLIEDMTSLVNEIDVLIEQPTQDSLLLIFADIINEIIENKDRVVSSIKHAFKLNTEADRNYANMLAHKFDDRVTRIAEGLKRRIPTIKRYCSPEFIEITKDVLAEGVHAHRMDLSKMKLFIFSHSAEAQKYGLTSLDVLQKLLEYPSMREKLTTVINAIDRGHFPKDGPAILEEAQLIARRMSMMQPNATLEMPEEAFQDAIKILTDPGEFASHVGLDAKKRLELERNVESGGLDGSGETEGVMSEEELEKAIKQRDKQGRSLLLDQLLRIKHT